MDDTHGQRQCTKSSQLRSSTHHTTVQFGTSERKDSGKSSIVRVGAWSRKTATAGSHELQKDNTEFFALFEGAMN